MTADLSAQWMTNGNTVQPGEFLGSTNQQDLRFKLSNQNRMRLMQRTDFLGITN
jgi:hypothetical protein